MNTGKSSLRLNYCLDSEMDLTDSPRLFNPRVFIITNFHKTWENGKDV